MARKLKPCKVSNITLEDGSTLFLYLDREKKDFFVKIGSDIVRAPSEEECRRKAIILWKDLVQSQIEWRKVIVVLTKEGYLCDCGKGLYLEYDVHEIGETPAGKWLERWDSRDDGEYWQEKYHGETSTNVERGIFVIPWKETTIAGLDSLVAAITETKSRLNKLLSSGDVENILFNVGKSLALPTGKKVKL